MIFGMNLIMIVQPLMDKFLDIFEEREDIRQVSGIPFLFLNLNPYHACYIFYQFNYNVFYLSLVRMFCYLSRNCLLLQVCAIV